MYNCGELCVAVEARRGMAVDGYAWRALYSSGGSCIPVEGYVKPCIDVHGYVFFPITICMLE